MKVLRPALVLVMLAMSMDAGSTAFADGHGGHHYGGYYGGYYRGGVDVVIGGPVWGPSWYYPAPYYYPNYYPYYYTPVVEVPSSPPVYIERDEQSESSAAPSGLWYYCPESKAYYPYVRECPSGWQTLPAEPLSEQRR